jgi:hypothetical protein
MHAVPSEQGPEPEGEVVDAFPVPARAAGPPARPAATGAAPVVRRAAAPVVRQAAAVAATSFLAGAATMVAARAVRRGVPGRRRRRARRDVGQVVATRTFLVDVHVLAPRG